MIKALISYVYEQIDNYDLPHFIIEHIISINLFTNILYTRLLFLINNTCHYVKCIENLGAYKNLKNYETINELKKFVESKLFEFIKKYGSYIMVLYD